jgi:hypothetical protein
MLEADRLSRDAEARARKAEARADAAEAASRDAIQGALRMEAASRDAEARPSRDAVKRAEAAEAELKRVSRELSEQVLRVTRAETEAEAARQIAQTAIDELERWQAEAASRDATGRPSRGKPSALGKTERDKLVKILGMLGSAYNGEQVAAMARADSLLRSKGKTWAEVLR